MSTSRADPRLRRAAAAAALWSALWLGGCALGPERPAAPAATLDAAGQSAFAQGVELLRGGNHEAAVPVFEGLAARFPGSVPVQINLGIAYQEAGREDAAVEALQRAVALDPKRPEAYTQLGILHRRAGRFEQARQSYEQALAVAPDYRPAHLNLGILCDLYLQRLDCALEHYDRYQALGAEPEKEVTLWIADLQKRMEPAAARPVQGGGS